MNYVEKDRAPCPVQGPLRISLANCTPYSITSLTEPSPFRPTLPSHKQQGDRVFSPAQHLSGTWPWLWASAALCQPLSPREDGTGHSRDCCLTLREKMWGFKQESQLGLGPESCSNRLKPGVGEMWACKEKTRQVADNVAHYCNLVSLGLSFPSAKVD